MFPTVLIPCLDDGPNWCRVRDVMTREAHRVADGPFTLVGSKAVVRGSVIATLIDPYGPLFRVVFPDGSRAWCRGVEDEAAVGDTSTHALDLERKYFIY